MKTIHVDRLNDLALYLKSPSDLKHFILLKEIDIYIG